MYKQLCDEIGDVVARHLGGEDVEADLAAWSRKFGETRRCAIPEGEEDTAPCESAQRLRTIASALGWTGPSFDGFWGHEAHGPVHDDGLMPILLDQLCGADGMGAGAINLRERAAGETAAYKFFQALSDLQARGKIYLHPKGNTGPDREGAVKVGWYDPRSATVYLVSEVALRQVKAYWRAHGDLFGPGAYAVQRDLGHLGCIESNDRGRYTRQVWISAREKTRRVLVLDAQRVYDKMGFALSDRVETHSAAAGPRRSSSAMKAAGDLVVEPWHSGGPGDPALLKIKSLAAERDGEDQHVIVFLNEVSPLIVALAKAAADLAAYEVAAARATGRGESGGGA